jgi:hypothetical protein
MHSSSGMTMAIMIGTVTFSVEKLLLCQFLAIGLNAL